MSYVAWFAKDSMNLVGFRLLKVGDLVPDDDHAFVYAKVASRPSPGSWLDGSVVRSRPEAASQAEVWVDATRRWVFSPEALQRLREDALDRVDECAGQVRLKYITSVPGQAETYQRKEEQARSWAAAGFDGTAPSFIAAEAAALKVAPRQVAEEVIALAEYWAQAKGPEIEAKRISGKASVRNAASPAEVSAALNAAIRALEAS